MNQLSSNHRSTSTVSAPLPPPSRDGTIQRPRIPRENETFKKLTQQTRNDPTLDSKVKSVHPRSIDRAKEMEFRADNGSFIAKERSTISKESSPKVSSLSLDKVSNRSPYLSVTSSVNSGRGSSGNMSPINSRRSLSSPSQRPPAGVSSWRQTHKITASHVFDPMESSRIFDYVPQHLYAVNYKNDIFEVLKDKIDQYSNSFHQSFQRLNKSIGSQGWCVKKEDFKRALIKDFHLFEDVPAGETQEHREIRRYQDQQKRKLDEFLDDAASKNDGYIRYSDFIKAIKSLDRRVSNMSTTTERQARYSSTMSNQANNIIEARKRQKLEREQLKPPPFALYDETEQYDMYYYQRYKDRLAALRGSFSHFDMMGEHEKVPYELFKKGLLKFDKYITEREVNEIYRFLDPKRKGYIDLGQFMDRFAVQILNNKSLRGTCETGFTHMSWPRSLIETVPRNTTIEELRGKNAKHTLKAKSRNTRTLFLRNDKIERDSIQKENRSILATTGYLSQEQRDKGELPFYHKKRPTSASATINRSSIRFSRT